jgi:hypothetical protein
MLKPFALALGFVGVGLSQFTNSPTISSTTTTTEPLAVHTCEPDGVPYWGIAITGVGCFAVGYLMAYFCHRVKAVVNIDLHEDIPEPQESPPSPEPATWASRVGNRPQQQPYRDEGVRRWLNSFDEETTLETQM